jgi:hypothetical protein
VVEYCQGARNERNEENNKTREKKTIGAAKSMAVPPYHSIVMPCKSWCRVAQGFFSRALPCSPSSSPGPDAQMQPPIGNANKGCYN